MPLNFSANISTLFTEFSFEERFEKVKEIGLDTIEIQDPYVVSHEMIDIFLSRHNIKCDLVNTPPGKFGCGSAAMRGDDFYTSLSEVTKYHYALKFKKLHIMSGLNVADFTKAEQFRHFVDNLKSTVDYLETRGIIGLLEPICPEVRDNYFLNDFDTALQVLNEVGSEQIKLLVDVFHLHKITGNVERFLPVYLPHAGHIQVSQSPGRCEPFAPGGEIDYVRVFDYLQQNRYSDYIGLEYFPTDSSIEAFSYLRNYSG